MIIDFHTHVAPPEIRERPLWRGKCPMTIENVLDAQQEAGIDRTVISYPYHELREMDAPAQLAAIARHNRYLASLQDRHQTIYALACASPYGGDAFLKELERAVRQDGCRGAMIMSSLPGHYPDDDDAFAFFALASELDVPVFVHPPHVGFGEERMRDYRLASSIGRPMDGALAIARLIVRGMFEKLPKLKLVGQPSRRRHLRDDRTHGLRLQPPGRGVFPWAVRADADQASAQPLPQDDVPGVHLLPRAGGALRARNGGGRPFRLRHGCPAAQGAQARGGRRHPRPQAAAGGRAEGVFRQCCAAVETLTPPVARIERLRNPGPTPDVARAPARASARFCSRAPSGLHGDSYPPLARIERSEIRGPRMRLAHPRYCCLVSSAQDATRAADETCS
jgi:hypothetical protein